MAKTDSLFPLPPRHRCDHKGTYGTAVLVAGSLGMAGAAALCARAALLSGAGLIRLLTAKTIVPIVAGGIPDVMTAPLAADRKGKIALASLEQLQGHLAKASAFGIGPGLGQSLGLQRLAEKLFFEQKTPAVFDADALNLLAARHVFDGQTLSLPAPRVLTPHPGEFARLTGKPTPADAAGRAEAVRDFFRGLRKKNIPLTLLLKGAGTIICDGDRLAVNRTGNPGMAVGGSGDVLTGIITAFLARGLEPFDAAALAAALHGKAGDLAARAFGMESLSASSLLEYLPEAFVQYQRNPGAFMENAGEGER
ncbi:MAG: NAD(P)H-hydrate dehydratase [Thermoguttaceae bacterium]|nr:NAD(P)H-hydrate dehydratase [Thermoguttaceae bacterium]MBR2584745.1 NAD(P)H-hydrate dehydratase [Thermoguttaceae bacterium]